VRKKENYKLMLKTSNQCAVYEETKIKTARYSCVMCGWGTLFKEKKVEKNQTRDNKKDSKTIKIS